MSTITISIPETLKVFIQTQMKKKGFDNVSEYFRTLIRKAQEQEENAKLDVLLMDGLRSGEGIESSEAFWKDLKKEADQLIKKHRKTK